MAERDERRRVSWTGCLQTERTRPLGDRGGGRVRSRHDRAEKPRSAPPDSFLVLSGACATLEPEHAPPGHPGRGAFVRAAERMDVFVLLAPLLDRWPAAGAFAEIVAALDEGGADVVVPDVARAFLLAGIANADLDPGGARGGAGPHGLILAVTATSADAEALAADAAAFLGPERVAVFPAWETLPHEPLSPRSETVARRLALIHRLARQAAGEPPETPEQAPLALLATPARAVMQPLAPGLDTIEPVRVARGDDHPVRVEFWGDEVEGIRAFAVASQRSLTELPAALAFPCREVRLTAAELQRARQLAAEFPAAGELLAQVADGLA